MAESFADLFGLNNNTKNSFDTLRFDSFKPTEFKPIMGGDPHMQGMFAGLYNASNALTGYANNKISEASRDTAQYSTNMFLNELQKAAAGATQEDIPYIISMFSDILENDQSIMQDKGREALNALQARTAQGEAEQAKMMFELAKKGMTGGGSSGGGNGKGGSSGDGIDWHIADLAKDRINTVQGQIDGFGGKNYGAIKNAVVDLTAQAMLSGRISRASDLDSSIREFIGGLGIGISEDILNKLAGDVAKEFDVNYDDPTYKRDLGNKLTRIKEQATDKLRQQITTNQSYEEKTKRELTQFTGSFLQTFLQVATRTKPLDPNIRDIATQAGTIHEDGNQWYNPTYTGAILQYIMDMDPAKDPNSTIAKAKTAILEYCNEYFNQGVNNPIDAPTAVKDLEQRLGELKYFQDNPGTRKLIASMLAYGTLAVNNDDSPKLLGLIQQTVADMDNARIDTEANWLKQSVSRRSPGLGASFEEQAKNRGDRAAATISRLRQSYGALQTQLHDYTATFDNLIANASAMPGQATEGDQQAVSNILNSMNLNKARDSDGKTVTAYYFSDVAHFNNIYSKSPVMQQTLGPLITGMRQESLIDFNTLVKKEAFALGPYWDGNGYAIGFGNHISDQFGSKAEAQKYIETLKKTVKDGNAATLVNDTQYISLIQKSLLKEYSKFRNSCLGPKSPVARLSKDPAFMKLNPEVQQNYISKLNTMLFLASYRGDLGNKAVKAKMAEVKDLKSAQALADTLARIKIGKNQGNGKNRRYGDFQFLG